jgi:hypothetical protein
MIRLALLGLCFLACEGANAASLVLSDADVDSLRGRRIVVAKVRGGPGFYVYTPVREIFLIPGMVGALLNGSPAAVIAVISIPAVLAAKIDGYLIARNNGIDDPALELANDLAAEFADAYGLTFDQGAADVPIVLVVSTRRWGVNYWFSQGTYAVRYRAHLTLRDKLKRRVLVSADCRVREAADTSSYDALIAGGAALVKTTLAAAVDSCAAEFRPALLIQR